MKPDKCLYASVVGVVVSTCCPQTARIIDSAHVKLDANNSTSSNLPPCGDQVAKMLPPIPYGNHWTVAILDRQARLIIHQNPLSTSSTFRNALAKVLSNFMSNLEEDNTTFTVAHEDFDTKTNLYNHGVHILPQHSAQLSTPLHGHLPIRSSGATYVFALLSEGLQTERHLTDRPKDACVESLEADLKGHKARIKATRISLAYAASALGLLDQISSKVIVSTSCWSQLPDIFQPFSPSVKGGLSEKNPYSRALGLRFLLLDWIGPSAVWPYPQISAFAIYLVLEIMAVSPSGRLIRHY